MSNSSDRMPTLRGLDHLDQAIAKTASHQDRLVLIARKAGALARLSRIDEARALIRELRSQNTSYDPRLSAWIMYCEGLESHFSSLATVDAVGRFRRAYAIAISMGDSELAAISAAWIASEEFFAGRASSAVEYVKRAFQWSDATCAEARARANLVVADLLSWSGDTGRAKHWYRLARECAIQDNDIAMQSVILYNAVAFDVADLVLADCIGPLDPARVQSVSLMVNSVANLDRGLGVDHLASMVPLLMADVRSCEGQWSMAIELLHLHLDRLGSEGQSRLVARFLAQRGWCYVRASKPQDGVADIDRALSLAQDLSDFDDLFVIYCRAKQSFRAIGDDRLSEVHAASANRCMESFRTEQRAIGETLLPILDRSSAQKNPA